MRHFLFALTLCFWSLPALAQERNPLDTSEAMRQCVRMTNDRRVFAHWRVSLREDELLFAKGTTSGDREVIVFSALDPRPATAQQKAITVPAHSDKIPADRNPNRAQTIHENKLVDRSPLRIEISHYKSTDTWDLDYVTEYPEGADHEPMKNNRLLYVCARIWQGNSGRFKPDILEK